LILKKIIFILLLAVIFQLSNTPSIQVSDPKTWINETQYEKNLPIEKFFHKNGDFYRPYQNIHHKEFILHKISHVVFFSFLTVFAYINFKRHRLIKSWLFVTLYAASDEIHQAFIVGRSGRMMDIVLDSTASFMTMFFIFIIIKMRERRKKIYSN